MSNTPKPQTNKTIPEILGGQFEALLVKTDIQGRHFWEPRQDEVAEATQAITQAMLDAVGEDIELRADIDDELRRFVPDIDERSLEVSGVPSSFTNLYTRAIVRSTQRQIRTAIKKIGGSDE